MNDNPDAADNAQDALKREVEELFARECSVEHVLHTLMVRHRRFSQTFANVVVRITNRHNFLHRCLSCPHVFDSYRKLRNHLSKRKHFVSPAEIKANREVELAELSDRVGDELNPADYPLAKQLTLVRIYLKTAYMEHFTGRNRRRRRRRRSGN